MRLVILLVASATAIRTDQEKTMPFCWNCCASAKCSNKTHNTRYFGKATFFDCEPVRGAYKKDGKVVTPEMVAEGSYFAKAGYVCEETCWMTLSRWQGGRKSKGSVFRGGGVDSSCVYERVSGLDWKREIPTPPPHKPKKTKKSWEEWFLEQGLKDMGVKGY